MNKDLEQTSRYNPLNSPNVSFNDEQAIVMENITTRNARYVNHSTKSPKHQFVVGMPGSGEAFVVNCLFFALCKGLNILVFSLSTEGAMQFGGVHLHDRLTSRYLMSVDKKVAKSLQRFVFDKFKTILLQRLDVLYFEEIGMISAEDFAAIDMISQKVRETSVIWWCAHLRHWRPKATASTRRETNVDLSSHSHRGWDVHIENLCSDV